MDPIIILYERIPILFWLMVALFVLPLVPILGYMYITFLESLKLNPKRFSPHFAPENADNKRAGDMQNKQCGPNDPILSNNTQHRDADDPDNNHSRRSGSSEIEGNVFENIHIRP